MAEYSNFPEKHDHNPSLGLSRGLRWFWRKATEAPPWLPWGWVWWAAGVLAGAALFFVLVGLLGAS